MEKVYIEKFTSRKWSLTSPSIASRLLYRLTGGAHGEEQSIKLDEDKMARYSTGKPQQPLVNKFPMTDALPVHINCRCYSFLVNRYDNE